MYVSQWYCPEGSYLAKLSRKERASEVNGWFSVGSAYAEASPMSSEQAELERLIVDCLRCP